MAEKKDITITIGGRSITLSGNESEEYMQQVADYLNDKRKTFNDDSSFWKLPADMRSLMVQLNIADDYMKALRENERIQKESEEKERALERRRLEMEAQLESERSSMAQKLEQEKDEQQKAKEAELEKVKSEREIERSEHTKQVNMLESRLKSIQEQVSSLQKKLYDTSQELKKEKNHVRQLSAGHNSELESLRRENAQLNNVNSSQAQELDTLHGENSRLEEENRKNSMTLQSVQNERNRLQNSLKSADEEIARRRDIAEQTSREIDLLKKSQNDVTKAVRRLEEMQSRL